MKASPSGQSLREWISLFSAIALGPASLMIGYQIPGLIFGAAAGAGIFICAIVVPLLTLAAGRLKFLAWQLAIISTVLAVVGDNLRLNAIHRSEVPSVAYVFWAAGTLLSSPLPIYFLLKPLVPRQRYVVGIIVGVVAYVLWFGLKRITG